MGLFFRWRLPCLTGSFRSVISRERHRLLDDPVEFLSLEPELISRESKRKILWDNALGFYQFPEEMIPEELTYQAKLRAAMFDAVNPQDITDIVKNRIAKAKEGDKDALKFVTDYLLGANSGFTFVQ